MTVVGRTGNIIITNSSRVSPRARQKHDKEREPWHDRHQVCSSTSNLRLNPSRREYFDILPTVRVRQGQYHQTWKRFAASEAVFSEQRLELEKLFERHPLQPPPDSPKASVVHPIKADNEEHQDVEPGTVTANAEMKAEANNDSNREPVPLQLLLAAMKIPESVSEDKPEKPRKIKMQRSKTCGAPGRSVADMLADSGQEQFTAFWRWCKHKFGGPLRCWAMLDQDMSMSLSRKEFFQKLAELKYPGKLDELWKVLDRDHSHSISFQHYHPEGAEGLAQFKMFAIEKFGSIKKLCESIDTDRNGKLTLKEFWAACETHGLQSLDAVRTIFQMNGFHEKSFDKGSIELKNIVYLDSWDSREYLMVPPDDQALYRWKSELLRRYDGNALQAWRKVIDKDASMRVNFLEFSGACKVLQKNLPETINIPGVWRALDENLSDWVSLREFDEESYTRLTKFRERAQKQCDSCQKFIANMIAEGDEKQGVSRRRFVKEMLACKEHQRKLERRGTLEDKIIESELTKDTYKWLFAALDIDGQGFISPHEVLFVDNWKVEEEVAEEEAWAQIAQVRRQMSVGARSAAVL